MTWEDPFRLIRWFSAVGSAYGVFLLPPIMRLKEMWHHHKATISLMALSLLYFGYGLLAGEDMTRILFLGFPFVMTWALLALQKEPRLVLFLICILSVASLRIRQIPIDMQWAVDYRESDYVWNWGFYFLGAYAFLYASRALYFRRKGTLRK